MISSATSSRSHFVLLLPGKHTHTVTLVNHTYKLNNAHPLTHACLHTCLSHACTQKYKQANMPPTHSEAQAQLGQHAFNTDVQFMWLNEQAVGWMSFNSHSSRGSSYKLWIFPLNTRIYNWFVDESLTKLCSTWKTNYTIYIIITDFLSYRFRNQLSSWLPLFLLF